MPSDDIAVPDVARRSGVSLATIYRYFPTKDALLDAAADEPSPAGRRGARVGDATADGPAYLRTLWRSFDERPAARPAPGRVGSRTGDARRGDYAASRGLVRRTVAHDGIDAESPPKAHGSCASRCS